jgi:hypothetical protein
MVDSSFSLGKQHRVSIGHGVLNKTKVANKASFLSSLCLYVEIGLT